MDTFLNQTAAQLKAQISADPWAWEGCISYGAWSKHGYVLGLRRREHGKITVRWAAALASARDPSTARVFKSIDSAVNAACSLGLVEVSISLPENVPSY